VCVCEGGRGEHPHLRKEAEVSLNKTKYWNP